MGDRPRQRFRRPSRLQSPPRQRGGGRQAPGAPSVGAGTPTLRGSFFSPGAVRKNTRGSESGALSGGSAEKKTSSSSRRRGVTGPFSSMLTAAQLQLYTLDQVTKRSYNAASATNGYLRFRL